ncbi:MAG: menaquinone biosynthesis decarboxylase [Candidatus Aenigmatarchaeota archaeon]
MEYRDFQDYLRFLEQRHELHRIRIEVDPVLEISEITDRVCKKGGPALLFERVKGSGFPVVTNAFGSKKRMCLALGVEDIDEIVKRVEELLEPEIPEGFWEKIRLLPRLKRMMDFLPKKVDEGCCKEVIHREDASFDMLPVLKTWPGDGGRYITLPVVFTRDPLSRKRNVGMYRMQILDGKRAAIHWQIHKDASRHWMRAEKSGQRMDVAVVLGSDPALVFAAMCPLPEDMDEVLFAGFLRQNGIELVKAETVDIDVPANAEIVIEGYVNPGELCMEGPFGDHTGFYSLPDMYPVFHLTCITRRKSPVYPATVVGKPPMEDAYMGWAVERIFLPLIRKIMPEIVDMHLPPEGVFHNFAFVSIDKRYPGHAKKVIFGLWGLGLMMLTKNIIVFDSDTDVHNLSEVLWKWGNNVDPRRDIIIAEGPVDALDHSSPLPGYGSKMGVDATKKGPSEGFTRPWPDEVRMSEEIREFVSKRWKDYGFSD